MQVQVHDLNGKATGKVELRDDVFGVPFNESVVHQALLRQLANRRQGTVDTKTRSDVIGSTRKLFAQKHTGRARKGDIRSPVLRGGGVAFGPHPRSYRQDMPKKMRRLALRCVLSAKAAAGDLKVVETFDLEVPKTRAVQDMLINLGIGDSAMIAVSEGQPNLVVAARNLIGVKTIAAPLINVADLLSYKALIVTVAALHKIEEMWGEKAVPARVARAR